MPNPMIRIHPIPAFSDNYIWALHGTGNAVCLVDPGEAAPCLAYLQQHQARLAAILITHHHPDHTGGVAALVQATGTTVYGPANSPFRGIQQPLADGDRVALPGCEAEVMAVPGHTLDHIAYVIPAASSGADPVVFAGDTLFAAGCGRLFEGTAAMMHASLQRLAALPPATRLYCAHEYTLANLRFAAAVEPHNARVQERLQATRQMREKHRVTLPSDMATERATNPFLRTGEPAVQQAAAAHAGHALPDAAATFAVLRQWKDQFPS